MKVFAKFVCIVILLPLVAGAAEIVALKNGFSIRHERREVMGDSTRLYLSAADNSSYIDIPTAQISSIAPDELPATSLVQVESPLAPPSRDVHQSVAAASSSTGVDADLIESVIRAESGYHPQAVSRKGAQGLMQLMPQTAERLGVKNSFDPEANIQGGSRYLRELLLQYKSDLARALAAYNAGPQRVSQYAGIPPYHETYAYVSRVIREFNRRKLAERALAREKKPAAPPPAAAAASSAAEGH